MISVIVPVYKSEKTLARCVKSLQGQTETDLEILLVDDGSPDDCPRICDDFAGRDKRIRVIHKENGGVSSARNAGIRSARGEYLLFADSDDFADAHLAERLLREMEAGDLAVCGFHHHYVGRDVLKVPEDVPETQGERFLRLYGQGYLNMPWNKLFRRELAGTFDESLSLGEDLLFNLDYLRRSAGISVVSDALYHYIQEDGGNTLSSRKRQDKLSLAKLVWREAGSFYRELTGHGDESGIINARLVQEVLDYAESLPFDRELSYREKLAQLKEYSRDEELRQAGRNAALRQADYRLIHFFMYRGQVRTAYLLCVLRAQAVRLLRAVRGREKV